MESCKGYNKQTSFPGPHWRWKRQSIRLWRRSMLCSKHSFKINQFPFQKYYHVKVRVFMMVSRIPCCVFIRTISLRYRWTIVNPVSGSFTFLFYSQWCVFSMFLFRKNLINRKYVFINVDSAEHLYCKKNIPSQARSHETCVSGTILHVLQFSFEVFFYVRKRQFLSMTHFFT